MGKLLSFVLGVAVAMWVLSVDDSAWHVDSYKAGRVDALSLSPVSWDLDAACVALWVGEQKLVEAK